METKTQPQTFNPEAANAAQLAYCKEHNAPHFAPTRNCYNCHQCIYEQIDHGSYKTGISVERAAAGLITGCPHCNRSYCD